VWVLVAGAGNIFLGDDGFGVEVVKRLAARALPEDVRLMDVGIRGVHLAYELLDGYDAIVLVDAVPHDEAPGTVTLFERSWEEGGADMESGSVADAHDLSPDSVFSLLAGLGGRVDRIFTVGCEPASLEEGIGLSDPVQRAIEPATDAVRRVVARLSNEEPRRTHAAEAERTATQEIPR
jgi:hydrogenase maturation protease